MEDMRGVSIPKKGRELGMEDEKRVFMPKR